VRRAALVYAFLVLDIVILHLLVPQPSGVLALAAIFSPYLFAPLLFLLPFAIKHRSFSLRLALAACALTFGLRFGPTLISLSPLLDVAQPRSTALVVNAMTWNLRAGNHQITDMTQVLLQAPMEIVALQEITLIESAAISSSQTLQQSYPYRVLAPHPNQEQLESVDGMALLTRYPIVEHGLFTAPAGIWARLDLGQGRRLMVINATPARARFRLLDYDPTTRDAHIRRLRTLIEPSLQRREPLLVLGDFNVTQHEPAYEALTSGLQDAHLHAGLGFGNTWRLGAMANLPLALLRIDYLLSSPQVRPLSSDVDCTPHRSDHCIVRGRFELVPE